MFLPFEGIYGEVTRRTALLEQLQRELQARSAADPGEVCCRMAENLLTVALLVIRGALARKESRGCHFRADFPEEHETFRIHTVQQAGRDIAGIPVKDKI